MNKKIGRFGGCLLCALTATAALGTALTAAAETQEGTLTLICKNDETVISDVQWRIYRAATRTAEGNFVLDGDFADYDVTFDVTSVSSVQAVADTLEVYTHTDSIEPLATSVGNSDGEVTFSGLSDGIYLISGDSVTIDNVTYTPSAALVEINSDTDSAEVYAYPKFSSETLPGGSGTEYQVFKSWAGDEDYPDARPESVSIDIYFNDEFYATAELNEDNDWTYSWTAEEDGEWLAVESDVPDGYTVTYQTSENQLAVVNTYTPPEEETPPADSTPDESTPDEESVPDEDSTPDDESIPDEDSSSPDSSTPDSTVDSVPNDSSSQTPTGGTVTGGSGGSDGGSLPQTGQLWWPVPILAGAGLILVVLGTRFKVKKESENEI